MLEVQFATAPDALLEHDAFISLPEGKDLYEEIASEVEKLLAI